MLFEIKHRWNGSVIFSAEIEASDEMRFNIKLGLAVKAAVLRSADLSYADLSSASLSYADLGHANLRHASLSYADLRYASLSYADLISANLCSASLSYADLRYADLRGADLRHANLRSADLRYANLRYASLRHADLNSANLNSADLSDADGVAPEFSTPLLMLLDQPGKIRAYKLVNSRSQGPFNGGITYEIGKMCTVDDADTDASNHCGAGINVATLDWCLREWREGSRILIVEFEAADIACIPTGTDGKFRLHKCSVVAEKTIDPIELGLVQAEEEAVEDES